MNALSGTIFTSEYRPCFVKGEKALFHRWNTYAKTVGESPLVGGSSAGQIMYTLGIVEFENGRVEEVPPTTILFVDNKLKKYAFD